MSAGKVFMAVIGAILALVAIGLLFGGGTLMWAYQTQRDADGCFDSPSYQIAADGYAIVTSGIDLGSHPGDWWPSRVQGTIKLRVRAAGGAPIFVGIGPTEQVNAYLTGVAHAEVKGLRHRARDLTIAEQAGGAPQAPPDQQTFWAAAIQGEGERTLTWNVARGRWSAVIMNADVSPVVSASVVAGVRLPILWPIGIGLLAGGFVFVVLASLLLAAATRGRVPLPSPKPATYVGYPAMLTGSLDAPLSPALWLVKWFLAIPHFVVLGFLWAAFSVLTVFAWIAILLTGRYPKGIFEFNVGVIRWTWRVAFYTYAALGTDRYPPFTLEDADYPARFAVSYPERLSRGLALIKWWLLAIPHYLIVGVFTSGVVFWTTRMANCAGDGPVSQIGGGLIWLLVILAGVALLFTGRYPRGLFDLVMGLNRWSFRVLTYAALLTDRYPPFGLDMGENEPEGSNPHMPNQP